MVQQFYDGFMKTDAVQNAITLFDKVKDAIGNVMDKLQDSKVFEQLGQDIGNIIAKVEDVTGKIADFIANLKTEMLRDLQVQSNYWQEHLLQSKSVAKYLV